ncbi:MAG: response regulator [Eubacteriales bacterium]
MNTINVLIADDEKIVREGLVKYVEWQEYKMQVVATADNGEAAFSEVNDKKIHLVITDIYMPKLDGMELIKKLELMESPPLVVLISGYSDFSYAQTALRSEIVQDYILKPLDFDQMDMVLSKVSRKIMSENDSVQFPTLDEQEWKIYTSSSATAILNSHGAIIEKLKEGDINQSIAEFEKSISKCREKGRSRNFISRFCIELAINVCELALENIESIGLNKNDPVKEITKLGSEEEIAEYVVDILKKAHEAMSKIGNENISPLIQAVLKYINGNYTNCNLSLNMISDEFNVSTSYVSNKFKEEVGNNFIKYLNGLRVKKAKELLKDLSLKVYMVSGEVGYEDVRYFSRIFRKYTGYTPSEYQKKVTHLT